jgi:hypothetical protein
MRKVKYILLLSILSTFVYSQDTTIVYYNHEWEEIDNKEYASFYRKSFTDSSGAHAVYDYFISGKIQMTGTYKTKKEKKTKWVIYLLLRKRPTAIAWQVQRRLKSWQMDSMV